MHHRGKPKGDNMFGFFKKRREKAERQVALKQLSNSVADSMKAEVALFIELKVVSIRHAFLDVLKSQLAIIDERMAEFKEDDDDDEITRKFVANNDLKLLIENWTERHDQRLQDAREFLFEEYDMAETIGISDELQGYVDRALGEQDLLLVQAGIDAVAATVGEEAVASAREALAMQGR